MGNNQNEGLKREIGVTDVAINTVNNIVGAGIFLLPALVAASIGNAAILAYLVCGIMVFAVMLCFAEASSRIITTGGAYAYIEAAFGNYAGFTSSCFYWFGAGILSDAAVSNGMLSILSTLIPWLAAPLHKDIIFFIFFGGLAFINIRGVKQGMAVVKIGTALKLLPLILFVAAGFFKIKFHNLQWQNWPSVKNLGDASLILFFAFMGGDCALIVSGEMKNPKRTAPFGLLYGIGMVAVFYILIQLVAQGILGAELQNYKDAPLAAAAQIIIGPIGVIIITIGTVISICSNISSSPLQFPRLFFAAAEDKLLPKFLSALHPKFATPYWAIIAYCSLDFIFAVSGGFKQLVIVSSACVLLIYLGVVLATIKLRLKKNAATKDVFKIPGRISVPIFAAIVIVWFLSHLAAGEVKAITIFAVIVTAVFFLGVFLRKKSL